MSHAHHVHRISRLASAWFAAVRPRPGAIPALLVSLIVLANFAGCETPDNTGSGTVTSSSGDALTHYNVGRYQQAYDAATSQINSGTHAQRDQARYIAGASAYRLGRNADAARHLGPLSNHRNAELAGRANATLGLIHMDRDQHEAAVRRLQQAVRQLSRDEDLAHAWYHLARGQQCIGRWSDARTSLSNAMDHNRDAAFREQIRRRIATTGFTIQAGSFASRSNAEQLASQISTTARRRSIGSPRVVATSASDGSTLYRVQVGNFSTYRSATDAHRRLGRNDAIVTLLQSGQS